MALSTSDVIVQLQQVSTRISTQRAALSSVINGAKAASTALGAIPTDFAALVSAINAYGTSDANEAYAKATLAKLTSEFNALKTTADAIGAATV